MFICVCSNPSPIHHPPPTSHLPSHSCTAPAECATQERKLDGLSCSSTPIFLVSLPLPRSHSSKNSRHETHDMAKASQLTPYYTPRRSPAYDQPLFFPITPLSNSTRGTCILEDLEGELYFVVKRSRTKQSSSGVGRKTREKVINIIVANFPQALVGTAVSQLRQCQK